MHRKALGRGLEALIPPVGEAGDERAGGPRQLPVADIGPNPHQPRTRFDDAGLQELAASIKASGMLQPVLVRRHADGYQLVAGERRLRAAQLAGLAKIPAILREVDDREMMELALIENIQREDLNPIDEAKAYRALLSTVGLTHDQLSDRVGKQRSSISNALRLLGLPVEVQEMVSRGTLSAGHARALLGIDSAGDRLAAARYILAKGFSVRRTEAYVARRARRSHKKSHTNKLHGFGEWETRLQQRFATRVTISPGRKGGTVAFEYYGDQDLERLLEAWGVV
ncbi:MAG: ParB/RepB/Spo0J family partition protein [Candidatus Eiseniibacteriota bacterium]